MPNVLNERVLTGNRALIRANSGPGSGKVLGVGVAGAFGLPQDISGTVDTGLQDVYALGDADRQELVVGATRYSMTVNRIKLNKQDSGFDPREIIKNASDMSIDIIDRKNGEVLESFQGVVLRSRNFTIGRNAVVTEGLTFEALTAEKSSVD